jgi:hypothetical protein
VNGRLFFGFKKSWAPRPALQERRPSLKTRPVGNGIGDPMRLASPARVRSRL